MADYTPWIVPGFTWTSQAAGAITGGDPLEVAGTGTVRKCSATPPGAYVGVAAKDAILGADVTVISVRPVHEGLADGAISAGDQLTASTAAGRQVKSLAAVSTTFAGTYSAADAQAQVDAAVTAARAVVGVALTTAADGGAVRWQQR